MADLVIHTDGSRYRNRMGYAAVIESSGYNSHTVAGSGECGEKGAHASCSAYPELCAIRLALSILKRPLHRVTIYTDSQTVKEALNGRQNISGLETEIAEVRALLAECSAWEVKWIKRGSTEQNRRADALANQARRNRW